MVKQALASESGVDILTPNNKQIEICAGTFSEVFSLDKKRSEDPLTNMIFEQEQIITSIFILSANPSIPSCSLKGEQNVIS